MSYIAVDDFGTHLFENKPIRVIRNNVNMWRDPYIKKKIRVPAELPRVLYENNMLEECRIPLYKRNMNWGDNPIYVKED